MPTKPDETTKGAYNAMRENPNFAKDALRATINETPELRNALLEAGLIKEE